MSLNPKELKLQAQQALGVQNDDPRRLTVLHEGVILGAGLLLAVLDLCLGLLVDQAGGLGSLGIRSALSTAVTFLDLVADLLSPFWSFGIVAVALAFAQSQQARGSTLLGGFHRFGPVLRLLILEALMIAGILIGIVYAGSMITVLLPPSPELESFISDNYAAFMENPEAVIAQMPVQLMVSTLLVPMLLISALCLAVLIPLLYKLALCQYAVLDKPGTGALAAISFSMRKMKGKCLAFFKLDLSFWWYYALVFLLGGVQSLDILLPQLGVTLPVSQEVARLILYALSGAGTLTLAWFVGPKVITTYANAYVTLRDE